MTQIVITSLLRKLVAPKTNFFYFPYFFLSSPTETHLTLVLVLISTHPVDMMRCIPDSKIRITLFTRKFLIPETFYCHTQINFAKIYNFFWVIFFRTSYVKTKNNVPIIENK
jgi:hypothetical protein